MTIGVTNYPGALDTVNELVQAVNRTSSLLSAPIDADDNQITVDDASLAPGSGVAWIDAEHISYTGKLGNTLTGCIRGFDGTIPASHGNGATVYFDVISAVHHNVLADAIIAIETVLGPNGNNIILRNDPGAVTFSGGFVLADSTDPTKQAAFSMASISAATMRTYTFPDLSGTFALTSAASATDNALVRMDGTTGKLVQASGATLFDSGALELGGINPYLEMDNTDGGGSTIFFTDAGVIKWEMFYSSATGDFFIYNEAVGQSLYIDGATNMVTCAEGLTIGDATDTTKQVTFDMSQIGTGVTATLSVPPLNGTIALQGGATMLASNHALSNTSSVQDIFPAAQNARSLSQGLIYEFEGLFRISRGAGTTAHVINLLFGGTATYGRFSYAALGTITNVSGATPSLIWADVSTATAVTASSSSATEQNTIWVKGHCTCQTNGTIIPQLQYSVAPGGAPTVLLGSFFRIWPVYPTTAAYGGWA